MVVCLGSSSAVAAAAAGYCVLPPDVPASFRDAGPLLWDIALEAVTAAGGTVVPQTSVDRVLAAAGVSLADVKPTDLVDLGAAVNAARVLQIRVTQGADNGFDLSVAVVDVAGAVVKQSQLRTTRVQLLRVVRESLAQLSLELPPMPLQPGVPAAPPPPAPASPARPQPQPAATPAPVAPTPTPVATEPMPPPATPAHDVVVLKNGSALLGTVLDYAKLSIKVQLAKAEDAGGLRLELLTDPRDFPMSIEEARRRFEEAREVIISLGEVESIEWAGTPEFRPQVEAVLAGLAAVDSRFVDLDMNVDPFSVSLPPKVGDEEVYRQTQLTLGPSGRVRIEKQARAFYAGGRLEIAYDHPGGEDVDATTTITIGGAADPFASGPSASDEGSENVSVQQLLALASNAPPDVSRQGAKQYIGRNNFFIYGEHELFVEKTSDTTDSAGETVEGTTRWYSALTAGVGIGRLINITGTRRLVMAERYLEETGLIAPGSLPAAARLELQAIYDGRVLALALAEETFRVVGTVTPPILLRQPTPGEVLGMLEVMQDAFSEREQGLELKAGLKVDLHPLDSLNPDQESERQVGIGIAALYEKPIDDRTQLSALGVYFANKFRLVSECVLLAHVEATRRYSQALTLRAFNTLVLAATPEDEDAGQLESSLAYDSPGIGIAYAILDRVVLTADASLVFLSFSSGDESPDTEPGYELVARLAYDLW